MLSLKGTLVTPATPLTQKPEIEGSVKRLEGIDGLRGLACLMVMLYHSWAHFGHIAGPSLHLGGLQVRPLYFFGYGYGGVDVFFVLSGFCLAYPIMSRPGRAVDWKQYAINRVRRIIPPYWAALIMFGVFALLISHYKIEPLVSAQVLGWPGIRQLIYSFLLISISFNSSFWTLPVEWRWYFVLPLLILLWRRVGGPMLVLFTLAVSLLAIEFFQPSHLEKIKFLVSVLPSFLFLFGLGILAAQMSCDRGRLAKFFVIITYPGIAVGLVLIGIFGMSLNAIGTDRTLPRLFIWGPFAFFLVLAAINDGPIKRLTNWRPLVFVGTFSYSLYLVHEPFLRAAAAFILPRHWSAALEILCQFVLLPVVLVGFAYLFFLVAEKPFLRRPVKKAIEAEQHPVASTAAAEAS